jgi:hypothetical protein
MLASNAGRAALVDALASGDPSAAFEAAWFNAARGMARSFPEPPGRWPAAQRVAACVVESRTHGGRPDDLDHGTRHHHDGGRGRASRGA